MTDSVYLFTGMDYTTNLLELALSTDDLVLVVPGSEMGAPPHDNTWHTSQWVHGEKLTRHRVTNRTWPIKLLAGDTDSASQADDLGDALISLELLVKQARRSHTDGDVDNVGLYFKLDGASNPTYYTVIDMECNGMSLMEEISRIRRDAQATFTLITEPFGYGDEETIENWLLTPHMQEDGNADGLADNWTEVGSPTTTIDTDTYICGSQSQKVVTSDDSSKEGVTADTIACTTYQSEDFVTYAWISTDGGTHDPIHFHVIGDSSGTIDSVRTDGVGTAVLETKTVRSVAWIKVGFAATVGASDTTLTVTAERQAADATQITTFYLDKCYLQFSVDTIPTAWCSQNTLYQHSDSDAGKVNYLDVDDVPGDTEAEVELAIHGTSYLTGYTYIGRRSSGEKAAALGFHQVLPEAGDIQYSADTDRINDGKWTSTPTSSWASLGEAVYILAPEINSLAPKYRVLISVNDANGDSATDAERADFSILSTTSGTFERNTEAKFKQHSVSTKWAWLDLGVVDLTREDQRRQRLVHMEATDTVAIFYLYAKRDTGSHAISVDSILLLPVEDDAFCVLRTGAANDSANFYIGNIGTDLDYMNYAEIWYYSYNEFIGGKVPNIYPGGFHRFYVVLCSTFAEFDLSVPADYSKIQLTYRPQTKFLFGS